MADDLETRIQRLESAGGDAIVEMELEGRIVRLSRSALREILQRISDAGGDVGPGPSRPIEPLGVSDPSLNSGVDSPSGGRTADVSFAS